MTTRTFSTPIHNTDSYNEIKLHHIELFEQQFPTIKDYKIEHTIQADSLVSKFIIEQLRWEWVEVGISQFCDFMQGKKAKCSTIEYINKELYTGLEFTDGTKAVSGRHTWQPSEVTPDYTDSSINFYIYRKNY